MGHEGARLVLTPANCSTRHRPPRRRVSGAGPFCRTSRAAGGLWSHGPRGVTRSRAISDGTGEHVELDANAIRSEGAG